MHQYFPLLIVLVYEKHIMVGLVHVALCLLLQLHRYALENKDEKTEEDKVRADGSLASLPHLSWL